MSMPSSLTPTRAAIVCELARQGIPRLYIAAKIGVNKVTLFDWILKGRAILDGEPPPRDAGETPPDYAAFVLALDEADADYVIASGRDINTAEKGHAGRQWWLERTKRDVFGATQKIEVEHSGVVHHVAGVEGLTDEQLLAIVGRRRAIEAEFTEVTPQLPTAGEEPGR